MFNKFLMSELDKLQDQTDQQAGKHIEIPLTVAILSQLIYNADAAMNLSRRDNEKC